jgi:hypothetical protein
LTGRSGHRRTLLGLVTILVAACTAPVPPPQAEPPGPRREQPAGTYRHVATGLELPETLGPYTRTHVTVYDADGFDVSGHYALEGPLRGIATVYHYPATVDGSPPGDAVVLEHFESLKRDLIRVRESATWISESDVVTRINGFALTGRRAVYVLDGADPGAEPLISQVLLYPLDGWYLKLRFSHPESESAAVEPLEQELLSAIRWPVPEEARSGEPPEACVELADIYEMIARNQDTGITEEEQIAMLGEPGGSDEERFAYVVMRHAISVAYAYPDAAAAEIRQVVLDDCTVGEDGQATLDRLWPWND